MDTKKKKQPHNSKKPDSESNNRRKPQANPESTPNTPKRLSFVGSLPQTPTTPQNPTLSSGAASPLKWTLLSPSGRKPEKRGFHSCTVVGSKFYIVGGDNRDKFMKDIVVFDTKKNSWSSIKNCELPFPRTGHTCVCYEDKLYIFGGKQKLNSKQQKYVSELNVFDLNSQVWSVVKPGLGIKIKPRAAHSCCLIGSKMFIFGGLTSTNEKEEDLSYLDQLLVFDMMTNTWSIPQTKGTCPSARAGHSVAVCGSHMYVFGGRKGGVLLQDVYKLNTEKMIWTQVHFSGNVPKERAGHTTVSAAGPSSSFVVLWGGGDWNVFFPDVHVFDLDTHDWSLMHSSGSIPDARFWHTSCVIENKMYVFGGGSKDTLFQDIYVLDLSPLFITKSNESQSVKPQSPSMNPILTIKPIPTLSLDPSSSPSPQTPVEQIRVKFSFNGEIRNLTPAVPSNITYAEILKKIRDNLDTDVIIMYKDDEDDIITIRSDEELRNCFQFFCSKKLSTRLEVKQAEVQKPQPTPPSPSPSPNTPNPSSPVSIKWHKGKILGQGAYGKVYLAINLETSHFIAVKEIKLSGFANVKESQIKDIANEINVMHKLNHENIVRYLGAERKDGHLYIFLEYVPGGSIASVISQFKSLHESVVRKYTKQILLGLKYLHDNNIIHRDIKGANILVDDKGMIKLADFGHSKLQTLNDTNKNTGIKGTPVFMAPETIKGKKAGKHSDIWSVGCTVIEMMTGNLPWTEIINNCDNQFAVMIQISDATRGPKYPANISVEGRRFLDRCFAIDPNQRPSVEELLNDPFIVNPYDVNAQQQVEDNEQEDDEDEEEEVQQNMNEPSPNYDHFSLINQSFESYVSGEDEDDNDDDEEEDDEESTESEAEEPPTPVNPAERTLASLQKQLNNIDMAKTRYSSKNILNFSKQVPSQQSNIPQDAQITSFIRQTNSKRSPSLQILNMKAKEKAKK